MNFIKASWPIVRAILPIFRDFSSTIVFISLIWITQDPMLATVSGVSVGAVQTVFMLANRHHIRPLQWMSISLVFILGTLSIVNHNAFFFKLKSSIMEFGIIAVLLNRKWLMQYLPAIVTENLDRRTILRASYAWVALMLTISTTNIFVAWFCPHRVWALFIFTVPGVCYITLFTVQYVMFRKRIVETIHQRKQAGEPAGEPDSEQAQAQPG